MAELRLGGPAREIVRLARAGTTIRVPLESVGSADTLISLRREWVELPEGTGLTVVSVSPASIRVSFERAITVTLPLALRVQGEVPSHLALASAPVLSPDSVRVWGPASRLAGLGSIPLLPFDLRSVALSGTFNLQVDTTGLVGAILFPVTPVPEVHVEYHLVRTPPWLRVRLNSHGVAPAVVFDLFAVSVQLTRARPLVTALYPDLLRFPAPPALLSRVVVCALW